MVHCQLPTFAVFLIAALKASALDKYIAAVYEHSVILTGDVPKLVTSEDALKLMNRNLDVLEGAIKQASEQVLLMTFVAGKLLTTVCGPQPNVFVWMSF